MRAEDRIPVIVGVGQINDRTEDAASGLDSLQLMQAALEATEADAGAGVLRALDSLAVVDQLSFASIQDIPQKLADAFGATPRICEKTRYPSGDSPMLLLNQAAERIRTGEIALAAVVGAEALRTAAARAKAGAVNAVRDAAAKSAKPVRARYGLVAPTDVYPLYENASRVAFGQSLAEGQRESAEIWSRLSEVAAGNPHAWLRQARTPEEIATPSADNRWIAFPYTKLMVANASVNQGAGFIVASLAKAKALGIAEVQLIYVGHGAAAHEPSDVLSRENYKRSIALETSLRGALEFNGLAVGDLDCVELYSCFPCIPKLARRAIGWPIERPLSVVGGLTFGGGPVGNYMSHAVAAMTERLRVSGGKGLLFGNGGFANTNHCIALAATPFADSATPRDFSVQAEADAQRQPAPPLVDDYQGPATVETYTVFYGRDGAPSHGVVVALTPAGQRLLANIDGADAAAITFFTSGAQEPVGAKGATVRDADGLVRWQIA